MDDFTKNIFPPPYSGPKPGKLIPDIFILRYSEWSASHDYQVANMVSSV